MKRRIFSDIIERRDSGMKNILAIGNSFSEDATRYLHQMAEAVGIETKVVNLFIGDARWSGTGRISRRKKRPTSTS